MSEEKWPGPPSSQSGEPKSQLRQQRGAGGGGAQAAVSHQGQGELHICMTVPHYDRPPLLIAWIVSSPLDIEASPFQSRCVRFEFPSLVVGDGCDGVASLTRSTLATRVRGVAAFAELRMHKT